MKERSKLAGGPPHARKNERYAEFSRSLSAFAGFLIPVIALLVLVLLVFILSDTPGRTLYFFFLGPFKSLFSFGNTLNAAIPLIIGALGVTIAMKAGNLNLGGEGQVYLGAFCSAALSLFLSKHGIGQFGVITGILPLSSDLSALDFLEL